MADLKPLVSTVNPTSAETIAQLEAEVAAAVADASILPTEIESSVKAILSALQSDSLIDETDPLKQLQDASPDVASFVQALQQSIFDAKAATPQGLLLAGQLAAGSITQAQFQSQVTGIVFTASQLQAATAAVLPAQTQILLLALSSNKDLLQLAKIVSKAVVTSAGDSKAKLSGVEGKTAEAIKPLAANGSQVQPDQGKLTTDFKDEKLSFLQNLFAVAKAIALQNLKASASSLISLKPAPRIMNGARAVLKINGKVVALCTNVSYEINMDWSEIRGVDELIPNDLAPMIYSVKGSMSLYRVPNKSPIADFIHQDMFRGMIWPYTTIEIRDKRTDELIMLVKRAAITSRGESFTKNQLTTTNMSFIGIGFRDEQIPEFLPDKLTGSDDSDSGLLDAFKAITNLF